VKLVALSIEGKKAIVAEVAEIAAAAHSVVGAIYQGIPSNEMNELRAKAREEKVYLRVVKNSLAKRAVVGTDFECIQNELTGSLVLAFSQEDPGAAGRLISDFAKANDKMEVKIVSVGGKLLSAEDIKVLAKMPTKDQAISMLMSVMKAPVTKFVRTLAEPHTKLVRTIAAVKEQKQAAG
jgi:large subunit ribosomal protein L10